MSDTKVLIENLYKFGVGRRRLDDELVCRSPPPARLGLCPAAEDCAPPDQPHPPVERGRERERGRYRCGQCGRAAAGGQLLALHVAEAHDSFFAALAATRPAYCCYVKECIQKFASPGERMEHCVEVHELPKDFRYDIKPKVDKPQRRVSTDEPPSMDVDPAAAGTFFFHNSKRKGFTKYSGKRFTSDKTGEPSPAPNVDQIMSDLKENLPND